MRHSLRNPTDFILRRARIHTLSGQTGATAIAVHNGAITAVGTDAEVAAAMHADTPNFDMGNRVLLPGFIDAHLHWAGYALMRRQVALDAAMGLPDVLKRVKARADELAPGQWIIGRGWDHTHWSQWPTAADLDAVAPLHPVALTRKDGHVMWLNGPALAAAGITGDTPNPPGGEIARTDGALTGILKESALSLVREAMPEPEPVERQAAMAEAWPDAWSHGIVGAHDMGYKQSSLFRDLSTMREAGELGLRFSWYLPAIDLEEAIGLGLRSGLGDAWLRVGGLKLFLDGTLGSQTAAMLAPYEGQPDNTGINVIDAETFQDLITRAADAGLATAVHAIGDAANRRALDGFAELVRRDADALDSRSGARSTWTSPAAAQPSSPQAGRHPSGSSRSARSPSVSGRSSTSQPGRLRHRVEHAQLLDPLDVCRFAELDVIASMQPIHAMADWEVADRYWGTRVGTGGYAWRTLHSDGARLAFGSDAPIETLSVFAGIHAAVTRQTHDGQPRGGWHPGQCLTLTEAIQAYTIGAAYAGGQETQLGSLEVGKRADLVVVDRDPFTAAPHELLATRVLGTMIDGIWVWQASEVEFGGPRQGG